MCFVTKSLFFRIISKYSCMVDETFGRVQWTRSPGKSGSHFDPRSDLFVPNEAKDVMTSTACWTAMLATVVALTFVVGPMWMLKLYVVPYWVIIQTFIPSRPRV
jgi:fatty acid desaturase